MPNIDKLLEQNNAGFKRYTGIHKATFYEMLEAMQQHETQKTKSERCTTSVWTLVFMSILLAVLFEK